MPLQRVQNSICFADLRTELKRQKEITDATSSKSVEIVLIDLGELASVRKAVEELKEKENKVDVLVCNGGVLLNDKRTTTEGNEVTFASHLLGGSYLLSQLLLPQFNAAEDPRIIFVSSGGMYTLPFPDWPTATVPKVPRMTTMATRHMPTPKGGRYSLPTNTLSSILELKLFLATQGGRLRQQWIWLTERIKSI